MATLVGDLLTVWRLKDELSPAVKKMSDEMNAAITSIRTQGYQTTLLGRGAREAGAILTASLTVPIIALTKSSVQLSSQFEATTARFSSLAGVAKSELPGVRQALLDLAPAVGIGPQALAEAMYLASSTTRDTKVALEIMTTSAYASAAGMGETKDVVRALSAIVNSYGSSNITAAQAADVMTKAIQDGGAEAKELAPTLANVVPFAAQMGISFQEVAANVATVTKLGVPTSEAITMVTSVMAGMTRENIKGVRALETLKGGVYDNISTYAKLREEVKDKGLAETLLRLNTAFEGQEKLVFNVVGRIEGYKNILAVTGAQAGTYREEIQRMNDAFTNAGTLMGAFNTITDTQTFKFNQLKAAVNVLGISIGDGLAPALKTVVRLLIPVAEWGVKVSKIFDDLHWSIQTVIVAIGSLIIVGGPLLIFFGQIAMSVGNLSRAIPTLIGMFGTLRNSVIGFQIEYTLLRIASTEVGASLLALSGPIGIAIGLIGSLALAMRSFGAEWSTIMSVIAPPIGGLMKSWEDLKKTMVDSKPIMDEVYSFWGKFTDLLESELIIRLDDIKKGFAGIHEVMVNGSPALQDATKYFELFVDLLKASPIIIDLVKENIKWLNDALYNNVPIIRSVVDAWNFLPHTYEQAKLALDKYISSRKNLANIITNRVDQGPVDDWSGPKDLEFVGPIFNPDAIKLIDNVKKSVVDLGKTIKDVGVLWGEGPAVMAAYEAGLDRFADQADINVLGLLELETSVGDQPPIFQRSREETAKLTAELYKWAIANGAVFPTVERLTEGVVSESDKRKEYVEWLGDLVAGFKDLAQLKGPLQGFFGNVATMFSGLKSAIDVATRSDGTSSGGLGNLSVAFDKSADPMKRFAAGIASAAQIAGAANAIWRATSVEVTKTRNAFSGAMAGASAGAVFGAWGIAAGAIGGAIVGMFRASGNAARKAAEDAAKAAEIAAEKAKIAAEKAIEALKDLISKSKDELKGFQDDLDNLIEKAYDMGYIFNSQGEYVGINFDVLKDKAEEFGLNIDELGLAFQQFMSDKETTRIINGFDLFKKAGYETDYILRGMKDEISKVVQNARQFGTIIPENMKPWIDRLMETGQLLDENGDAITNISDIKFGPKVENQFDIMQKAIQKVIAKIDELVSKIADMVDKLDVLLAPKTMDIHINTKYTTEYTETGTPPSNRTPPGLNPGDPGYAFGTLGASGSFFKNFGSGTPTVLHGEEAVVRRDQTSKFVDTYSESSPEVAKSLGNIERLIKNQPRVFAYALREALVLSGVGR